MPHEDPNVKEIDQFPNTPIKNTCPSLITIVLIKFHDKKKSYIFLQQFYYF